MASFEFDLNAEAFTNALQALPETVRHAAATALYEEAEAIMADSKEHYVPVDEGTLRGSGHVQLPQASGDEVSIEMGYGGPAESYAMAIHEHLSAHSPRSWRIAEAQGRPVQFHPAGRGPKFLERPLLDALRGMAERLMARIAELLGG